MTTDEAKALVASTIWYHSWEIVPGVRTPGRCAVDPKATLDAYGIPENLDGKRALDIGAWDGVYSFELERRGADVVSLDIQHPDDTGYNVAKEILGSECTYVRWDVCDIDSRINMNTGEPCIDYLGQFDIVLYMGVFYHLKEPMLAFERIKSIMKPDASLYFEGLVFDHAWARDPRLIHRREEIEAVRDMPIAYFASEEFGYDESNWYVPTLTCLYGWLQSAGFDVKLMGVEERMSRAYGVAKIHD